MTPDGNAESTDPLHMVILPDEELARETPELEDETMISPFTDQQKKVINSEEVLRDLEAMTSPQISSLGTDHTEPAKRRPITPSDLKFPLKQQLRFPGTDPLLINKLEEQVLEWKRAYHYDDKFLMEAVRLQCEQPKLLEISHKGFHILNLQQLFAQMRDLNHVSHVDTRVYLDQQLDLVKQKGDTYLIFQTRMLQKFSEVLQYFGKDPGTIEREIEMNLHYLKSKIYKGLRSDLREHFLMHLGTPEVPTLTAMTSRALMFEEAKKQAPEPVSVVADQIHAINLNREHRPKMCKWAAKCYKANCKFSHPEGRVAPRVTNPYQRPMRQEEDEAQHFREIKSGLRCGICLEKGHRHNECTKNSKSEFINSLTRFQIKRAMPLNPEDAETRKPHDDSTSIFELDSQNKVFIKQKGENTKTFNVFLNHCFRFTPQVTPHIVDTGVTIKPHDGFVAEIQPSAVSVQKGLDIVPEQVKSDRPMSLLIKVYNRSKRAVLWDDSKSNPLVTVQTLPANVAAQVQHLDLSRDTRTLPVIAMTINGSSVPVLVDTGAARNCVADSIVSRISSPERIKRTLVTLTGAGQSQLQVKGAITLKLFIGSKATEVEFIVIRDLARPIILGFPTIESLKGQINAEKGTVTFTLNEITRSFDIKPQSFSSHNAFKGSYSFHVEEIKDQQLPAGITIEGQVPQGMQTQLTALLSKYQSIFTLGNVIPSAISRSLGEHSIELKPGTRPLSQNPRRISPSQRETVTKHIKKMLADGVIRPSVSAWASPVVLAPKKNGETRFCVDYRKLNTVTIRDVYPLPCIDDIIDALAGARFLSKLDLASGYHQVMMSEESAALTAFTSHEGLYEYTRMPFGLTNAPATFQRMMDTAMAGLKWKCCLVYLDDIVIYSKTFQDHLRDLEAVFQRVAQAKLSLRSDKCHLCCEQIKYLGHLITRDGIREDPDKVETIKNFPRPHIGEKKALMSFLGMTGHFQKFINNYHVLVEPLRELLKEDTQWQWTPMRSQAFEEIKRLLTEQGGPVLTLPDMSGKYPFSLHCDASDVGLGAVLYQRQPDGSDKVIQYASRTLSPGERKWHTTEKEALAIIWACEKFAPYLIGPKFKVVTDHASLQWLWDYKKGRLARWALRASEFDFDIVHKPGKENVVPDHASRYPQSSHTEHQEEDEGRLEHALVTMIAATPTSVLVGCDLSPLSTPIHAIDDHDRNVWNVADWQQKLLAGYDQLGCKVSEVRRRIKQGCPNIGDLNYLIDNRGFLRRNISLPIGPTHEVVPQSQLVIPLPLRGELLEMFHANVLSGHLGRNKMYSKMLPHVWWPGMYRDVRRYVAQCVPCQRHKGTVLKNRPLFSTEPNHTWETACIDLIGPLPISDKGNKYICVITDPFTKWAEAIAIPTKSEESVSEAVFNGLICRHSVPRYIRTDQGTEFTNNLMSRLMDRLNIRHKKTCPYYPQANGHVERFNRTLVESLAKQCEFEPGKWEHFLEGTLFAYRTSVHDTLKCSPFEMLYGRQPLLPIHILQSSMDDLKTDVKEHGTRLTYNLYKMAQVVKKLLKDTAQERNHKWSQSAKPVALEVGDWILLKDKRTKVRKQIEAAPTLYDATLSLGKESAKFQSDWLGPYLVTKVLTNAVVIDDTDRQEQRTVSVAHVKFFHTNTFSTPIENNTTQASADRPLHSQNVASSDSDLHSGDDLQLYVIEKVLGHRRNRSGYEYLIKWEGFDESHNSWTPTKNIQGLDIIEDYWRNVAGDYSITKIPCKYRKFHSDFSSTMRGGEQGSVKRRKI